MGMAASQARYLTLTARKSNVEYEGQQINQSRTALANQSANLFNQMLTMEVPTPPSTQDFTTVQYSYSDGVNTEVLSSYEQLGSSDPDYNYVVTTYHNEKVYTGSRKKLQDPQVTSVSGLSVETEGDYSYSILNANNNKSTAVNVTKTTSTDTPPVDTYTVLTADGRTSTFKAADTSTDYLAKEIQEAHTTNELTDDATSIPATEFSSYTPCTEADIATVQAAYPNATITKDNVADYYKNSTTTGEVTTSKLLTKTQATGTTDVTDGKTVETTTPTIYTDGSVYATKSELDNAAAQGSQINVTFMSGTPRAYASVGNCELTELNNTEYSKDEVKAAIEQIRKDMKSEDGDSVASANLESCFDADGNYVGGLYQFKMNGQTYYTTKNDLDTSYGSSILSPDNEIDAQQDKLIYYIASYLDKKIETTQKALLQTDEKGRFSSLKLEDESVVYSLDTSSTTDQDAYNDAMNQYYYKEEEYEKAIADINAKTEIIQAQDRTLELRLEQLNTEQSALQNEMEAVKKVVDKHVELGFKTFGG